MFMKRKTKPRGQHPHKALSAAFVRSVAQAGRYCDGNGLYLHVDPSGARRWVQRLVIRGTPRTLGLGGYAVVSLAEARDVALVNRKLARTGGDPLAERRHARGIPTFEEATATVLALHRPGWRNAKHATQWATTLRKYAHPHLGALPVSEVTTADVLTVLTPIWHDKSETARRLRQRIGAVMKWAIAKGYRPDNPAGDAMAQALPRQTVVRRHMRALPHREVAGAIQTIRASRASTPVKLAFEFLVLTAARSGEVRLATWDEMAPEVDGSRPYRWMVPGGRAHESEAREITGCRSLGEPRSRFCTILELKPLETRPTDARDRGRHGEGRDVGVVSEHRRVPRVALSAAPAHAAGPAPAAPRAVAARAGPGRTASRPRHVAQRAVCRSARRSLCDVA